MAFQAFIIDPSSVKLFAGIRREVDGCEVGRRGDVLGENQVAHPEGQCFAGAVTEFTVLIGGAGLAARFIMEVLDALGEQGARAQITVSAAITAAAAGQCQQAPLGK